MNKDNLSYNDVHNAWNQRIKRELGASKFYTAKGYVHSNDRNRNSKEVFSKSMSNYDKLNF